MRPRLLRLLPITALCAMAPHRLCAQASVDYTLRVESAAIPVIAVEMRLRGAPAAFHIAMVAHPEYDDAYWRYLTDLRGESARGAVTIVREDSSLWRVSAPSGDVTLRYRVRYPESRGSQAAWMGHLTRTGGLIGGPHSFLYVVGAERVSVRATVVVPDGWRVVTGLDTVVNAYTFASLGAEQLVDSPMLVGNVRPWRFDVDGVSHGVSYLGAPAGVPFDTVTFVAGIERYAREAVRMFGRMPYRRYEFLIEDNAYGGLEHTNSVSIGARSADLARDPNVQLSQFAHEFFHTWNEVHLRPASWIGIRPTAPEPTGELWWSEGVTLYYADLLQRRAGLPTSDSTRLEHMAHLIAQYLANPSHAVVAPERTSRAFNKPLGALGDYTPSMFVQGEMLGAVLDLMILEGSGGRRTLDDAMRAMSREFSMTRGFTGADIERAVAGACTCDARPFFDQYVRAAHAPDLDRWLRVIGVRAVVSWVPGLQQDGTPAADLRFSAVTAPDGVRAMLNVWFPAAPLGRAGFHTGDILQSVNGASMPNVNAFRAIIGQLRVGDTLSIVATRGAETVSHTITIGGYVRPVVRLDVRPDATPAQRARLETWLALR